MFSDFFQRNFGVNLQKFWKNSEISEKLKKNLVMFWTDIWNILMKISSKCWDNYGGLWGENNTKLF